MDQKLNIQVRNIDEGRQGEAFEDKRQLAAGARGSYYIESYGCQMNFSDSEIVASILAENGFQSTSNYLDADLILINTCSIRDNAEQRVRGRLKQFNRVKKNNPAALVGVLGCMAERLKQKLLEEEKIVDIVVGPDAYRDLPALVKEAGEGAKGVNVMLSREETYADISPVRLQSNGVSAFISIMRGCDNMCSFCVVPFTRGRERSRDPESIVAEAQELFDSGYREVTLLGQNVDSYLWYGGGLKKDFDALNESEKAGSVNFAGLLEMVARIDPALRIRFSTSNPQDMTNEVIHVMSRYENICNYIHLPVQSGSTEILEKMNRGYTREWYLDRIKAIREIIPDCGISSDIITGFCGESEKDHQETLSLMDEVRFDMNYMFYYSERPGTLAERKFEDDVPLETKKRRLSEVIRLQQQHSFEANKRDLGRVHQVLVEGTSKKSRKDLRGRNDQNKMVIFPQVFRDGKPEIQPGTYVKVLVEDCTSATLKGRVI